MTSSCIAPISPRPETYFRPSGVSTNRETIVWPGITKVIGENLHRLGAVGVRVTCWSFDDQRQVKRVLLDSDLFEAVTLSLEEVNLIANHLFPPATTETVFVMAQAIANGIDLDLVYDAATGQLRTPHAARKAVAS